MLALMFQSIALTIIIAFASFTAFVWLVITVITLYSVTRQKHLSAICDLRLTTSDAPLVSILVPARNEQHRILEPCIRSILAQDYGNFEVIAVNDRSTDATGAILNTLAENNAQLRVIEGAELPADWLGKPHAMHQAFNIARGEWILATDADMIFEPSALRTAVDHTLRANGDALTLIPHFEAGSFWERVMIPTWSWVFLMFTLFYRIHDPKTDRAAGIGGFFLLRRTVLERVGGYEALRDEVMEDLRLAEKVKRSGATLLIDHAPALIRTRMYQTFGEMWECSTKNWFSGVNFSLPFALYCVFSMYSVSIVPVLLALVSAVLIAWGVEGQLWWLFIPALLSWLLQILVMAIVSARSGVFPGYGLTAPLGLTLLYAMLFDSSIRITSGRGVTWKGRKIYERSGVRPPRLRAATPHLSELKE